MNLLRRRITIILMPDGSARAERYRIPVLALIPAALACIVTLYGAGFLVYQRQLIARQQRGAVASLADNSDLRRQNALLSERTGLLARRLDELARQTERFKSALGFDGFLKESVGGPALLRPEFDLGLGFTGRLTGDDLDRLSHRTTNIDHALTAIEQTFRSRSELLSAVPSIAPMEGRITSRFGYRRDPFTGMRAYHPALDISGDQGSPVIATADGEIAIAGYQAGYGRMIEIRHGYGFSTRYGHLLASYVKQGVRVKKGEIIGAVGSSGRSTGYHLHYEVRIDDEPVDPSPYMVEFTQQASLAERLERSLRKRATALPGEKANGSS